MQIVDEARQRKIFSLIEKHIKKDRLELTPLHSSVEEDLEAGASKISISIKENKKKKKIKALGSGVVDSIFNAFMEHYSSEYLSLKGITLTGFEVVTKLKNSRRHRVTGTDTKCEVRIAIDNASGNSMLFFGRSNSLLGASLQAATSAFEYYVNAEKCFILLRDSIRDAKSRNRGDIISVLTYDIAEIVSVTNYDCLE